ncbi:DUF3611 family protein [Thiocapsa marina]|uniref:DUF3611 family protein n=1 Tax=Thiocapsa marina 5811 TaxID=768671 RepID=F9UCQ4_9GAMM|nr:DUF3611 family protein [Thiocapsa marina]EGV18167.1 hypothetical protein ThimaDRAFT_2706 [Thiocapsa marina 5811]
MSKVFKNWVETKLSDTRALPHKSLAKSFKRLGWTGFWIQVLVGVIPLVLMLYSFVFAQSVTGPRAGLPIVEYLTLGSLAMMIFTTFWFFRYTRIADEIKGPGTSPTETELAGSVWIGLLASSLAIFFTITVMFVEVAHLLFYFLAAPQGGVPVIQTTGAGPASWVSAVDMLSLMSMVLTLLAELVVMVFSLWLLFRVTEGSPEYGGGKVVV